MRVWRTRIVGCGGIGGYFAPLASKMLTWSKNAEQLIHLHDADEFEDKNRERQMFFGEVGDNKAQAMADMLHALKHPLCELKVHPTYVEDEDHVAGLCAEGSAGRLLGEFEVWCLCVDNDFTRNAVYQGISDTHCQVMVIDMANELHTGDVILHGWYEDDDGVRKWHPEDPFAAFPQLVKPQDKHPAAYCQTEAPNHPQLAVTNAMAATIGARMLWQLLTGEGGLPSYVTFDLEKYRARQEI